jgi:hypothetical protein
MQHLASGAGSIPVGGPSVRCTSRNRFWLGLVWIQRSFYYPLGSVLIKYSAQKSFKVT